MPRDLKASFEKKPLIAGGTPLSFILKMFHCFQAAIVSDDMSMEFQIFVFLYVMYCFSLVTSKIVFLVFDG